MGSCLCSQVPDVSDTPSPSETKSLKPTIVSNESNVALQPQDKLSIHNKRRTIFDKYDRYNRKLLLSGYVRSSASDNCLIPSEIEEIIKQYHYPFSLLFTANEQIDYKDNDGYWFLANIEIYKSSNTLLSSFKHLTRCLTSRQKEKIVKYDKLEGILISYKEYSDDTMDTKKWIFIEKETICDCDGKCITDFHIINKANSNDKISKLRKPKVNLVNHAVYAHNHNHPHQGLSTGNVDWNSPTFQKLENNLRNMKQPNWNSPTFQRLERDVNNMRTQHTNWNSPQFQRMNVSLNNRSNFHSVGFGGSGFSRSAGFGSSFGTSSGFRW
eukprot:334783_1